MAIYKLEIKDTAQKQMKKLPKNILESMIEHILALQDNPRPHGVKKLAGGLGWRIRIGDYRVIYQIDDTQRLVKIVAVKSRQSAYD